MGPAQELDPGHVGQPLVGQHQRDLLSVLAELPEGVKGGRGGGCREDLVVGTEAPLQRLFQLASLC
jgi:hypothetical protein